MQGTSVSCCGGQWSKTISCQGGAITFADNYYTHPGNAQYATVVEINNLHPTGYFKLIFFYFYYSQLLGARLGFTRCVRAWACGF
mgnify:CR=1 FL=1